MDIIFLSFCYRGTNDGSDELKHAAQHLYITDMNRIKCSTVLYGTAVVSAEFFRCISTTFCVWFRGYEQAMS
jgi:hypothetical protein